MSARDFMRVRALQASQRLALLSRYPTVKAAIDANQNVELVPEWADYSAEYEIAVGYLPWLAGGSVKPPTLDDVLAAPDEQVIACLVEVGMANPHRLPEMPSLVEATARAQLRQAENRGNSATAV